MEAILQDLTNVVSFFDDVIVFAKNFEEMLSALNATLERMQQNGLRLNRSKCIFAATSLECLGHRIDRHGLHKSDRHIAAIRDAPKPSTPEELQLFLVYKSTSQNTNADYCSRIPNAPTQDNVNRVFSHKGRNTADPFELFVLKQVQQLPVRSETVARETRKDAQLGEILQRLEQGKDLTRLGYKAPQSKYSLAANCLMYEHRVVIPPSLRKAIIDDLHAAHIGIVKMKGIDADIELAAKSCSECAQHAMAPPKFNHHHWEYPNAPWERIHIDYAGPVAGPLQLMVGVTTTSTTNATIRLLDDLFASYGVPITVVSDNGPQFTSPDFMAYLKNAGVKYHKLTAPYHPATNGQAERYVQTVKKALKAMGTTRDTLQRNLNTFLLQFRKAPHIETGDPQAKLFLGRNIRTRIDLVRPHDITKRMTQKHQSTFQLSFRTFSIGQKVYFLSGNPRKDKWIIGVIIARLGDLHYNIRSEGKIRKRHVDQIRTFHGNVGSEETNDNAPRIPNLYYLENQQPSINNDVYLN
uniref:Integrase catalytic domain-containing protein n=1 Tax=Anopheles epiroticus TaxID=199890 RepID=A0A182PWL4_9DIPT